MKKCFLVGFLALGACSPSFAATPYFEAQTGLANESYGFRGGAVHHTWDFSAGYLKHSKGKDDIHLLSLEVYKKLVQAGSFGFSLGGGVGYAIPKPADDVKADNDHAWIVGGQADYTINNNWSIVGSLKGHFLTVDTHRQWFGSHTESLNGQNIEVSDEFHQDDSRNYDSILVGLAVRYCF